MGKVTGFLEYERNDRDYEPVEERVRHWREFILPLKDDEFVEMLQALGDRRVLPVMPLDFQKTCDLTH